MAPLQSLFGDEADILADQPFQLLFLTNGVAVLGLAVLSPILDSLIAPFNTTTASVGLFMSVFMAPSIIIIPLVGVLSDRYGRKPLIITGLLIFGIAGTAIAFTTSFYIALTLRFLQGIGFASILPNIITSLGDIYTGAKESTAHGFRLAGSGLFQTIFPIIAGILVAFAWQYPFFLFTLTLPVAILMYLSFEEPTTTNPIRTKNQPNDASSQFDQLKHLLSHRRVQIALIAYGLYVIVWLGFLTFNSIIVVQLIGGTPAQAGLLAAIGSFAYAGAATQAGRISAHFDSRYIPLLISNVSLGAGFIIFVFSPVFALGIIGIILSGSGMGVLGSLYRSIITGLAPPHLRGSIVSLAEAVLRFLATTTPIAMGAIIAITTPILGTELAIQTAGTIAAILSAGGGILCLIIMKTSPPVPNTENHQTPPTSS